MHETQALCAAWALEGRVRGAAAAAALLCHRYGGLSLRPQTLTYDQTDTRSHGLPFNGLNPVIHVITWITTHLPTPDGWKAELVWL